MTKKPSRKTPEQPTVSEQHIALTERYAAHNYHPLSVVVASASGCWVEDCEGKRYLDMLSAYSALNFGHNNERFVKVAEQQLRRLTMTSRAFYNDQLGPFCKELAEYCELDMVLTMNSGAEAVETSIKAARKWAYEVKGVPPGKAEIVVFQGNFHGRTVAVCGFSTEEKTWKNYGPYAPGFPIVAFGDFAALSSVVHENTAAILIEPIQGEGGIIIPPEGYWKQVRELCTKRNVLLIDDEIQTGLGRTGKRFALDHEAVKPDMVVLGKSLGGGIVPISAVVGRRDVMEVFTPGTHGSTFGGNPFASAIAREVIAYLRDDFDGDAVMQIGAYFAEKLHALKSPIITAIRQRGLMLGVDIDPDAGPAYGYCEKLKDAGVLTKDTRKQTIRFAPPLGISREEIDWGIERIKAILQ